MNTPSSASKMHKSRSLPNEWADDQVMDFLFSPFRGSREVNPRSWDSKMKFWTDMIRDHCVDKKVLTIDPHSLVRVFERNGKVPSCLNIVLEDLKRRGTIQTFSDYCESAAESSWLSWSVNWFVKKPVKWSYNNVVKKSLSWAYGMAFGQVDDDHVSTKNELPKDQYVLLDLVKPSADAIYQRHCESVLYDVTDNLVGYSSLEQRCRDICSDQRSFYVAVLELIRQKKCSVITSRDGEKLLRMSKDEKDFRVTLTEKEEQIYKLKTVLTKLEGNIAKVNEEVEQCRLTAKSWLQQGKKSEALKCLKRKKKLAESLAQKERSVDKINELIEMIKETETQKQVVDAFDSGAKAYKEVNRKDGLTLDKIDDTMLDVQEAFDTNEQLNQALAQPMGNMTEFDETELENELEEMLKVKPSTPSFDMSHLNLPDVPQHDLHFGPEEKVTSKTKGIVSFQ